MKDLFMKTVTFSQIIELNKILQEKGLNYKIHISDACGQQSMWIEALDSELSIPMDDSLNETIIYYFAKQGMGLDFSSDRGSFWVAEED